MMVDKFSYLGKKFKAMYQEGKSYEEMARILNVNYLTLRNWRVKLGLPPRRDRTQRSWMDIPTGKGFTPREILQSVAKRIGITENDIEFILTRVDKLKSKGLIKGRRYEHIVLAAAFMYLRWEGSGRRPRSATEFAELCDEFGLTRSALLRTCRLFTSAGLYPKERLRPETFLERSWKSFQEKYALPDAIKARITSLLKEPTIAGRTPSAAVAGCAYIACVESNNWITQDELSKFFGVTEVSIRNIVNCLKKSCPSLKIVIERGGTL